MKSLLDGTSTTVDSPSFQQPPPPPPHSGSVEQQSEERCSDAHVEKVTDNSSKPTSELFSPNEGYGVINFQKIDHSPTNASVTSDITSSVIFGSGDFRKPSFMKPLDRLETTIETFDQELLAERSIPDPPTSTLERIDFPENPHESFFIEITNPIQSKDQLTPLPGNDFSKLATSGGSFIDQSTSASAARPIDTLSHLKSQFQTTSIRQQDADNRATQDRSQSKCSDGKLSEAVHKAKLAFLSQLACGAFTASSFAFCASGNCKK